MKSAELFANYTSVGLVGDVTDEEGRRTHFDYDSNGNVLDTIVDADHLALKTTFAYNLTGDAISIVDPRGYVAGGVPATYTTTISYDPKRRRTLNYANALYSTATYYGYDADDRPTTVTRYLFPTGYGSGIPQTTTTTYTMTGQPFTVTDANNVTTTYGYDVVDRVATTTMSSGRQVAYTYDTLSRIATVTDAVSGTLDPSIATNLGTVLRETRTYTPNGLLASSKDARSNTTSYVYDGFDRAQKTVYPNSTFQGLKYDAANNVIKQLTRAGDSIILTYDARNRLLTRAVPANANFAAVTYTSGYDYSGLLMQIQQSTDANPLKYGYDTAGRVTSEQRADLKTVTFTLDGAGNRTGLVWPETGAQAYQTTMLYDPLNRLTDVYEGSGTGGLHLGKYSFDTLSERTELDYGNGAVSLYTYAPNSLLQSVQHNFAAGASVTFTSFRNTENEVKAATITNSTYGPSTSNPELAVATHTYTPNTLNQYASIDSTTYTYDTNGNLTGDGVYTYKYDPQNRLVSTTKSGTTITYSYDPLSRRLTKTVNGVTANYLSAGSQEIGEYDGSGNLVRRYVYGAGIDEPLTRVEVAGTHYYHHTDTLGSVIALTDSTDTVIEKHPHTMYGVGDTTSGSAYQFTGRRIDNASGDTGLYYDRNRMYSPTIGRFLSTDPIGANGGLNIYAYVGNDPLNYTDPFGLANDAGGTSGDTGGASEEIFVNGYRGCANDTDGIGSFCIVTDYIGFSAWLDSLSNFFVSLVLSPANAAEPASQPQTNQNCSKYPRQAAFVNANLPVATQIANQVNTTPGNILGLAGYESNWGGGQLITAGTNNYFSLKAGPAFATSASGTYQYGPNTFWTYPGPGMLASGNAFAQSYFGARVTGTTSPQDFAAALNAGGKYNSSPAYNATLVSTINQANAVMGCQ